MTPFKRPGKWMLGVIIYSQQELAKWMHGVITNQETTK
jgi:hypothetical protein